MEILNSLPLFIAGGAFLSVCATLFVIAYKVHKFNEDGYLPSRGAY